MPSAPHQKRSIPFSRPSRKTILLVVIVAGATLILSAFFWSLFYRPTGLYVPSLGTMKTLGVEAYWDIGLQNKTETIEWGVVWPGSSISVTLYIKSTSNAEVALILDSTDWEPASISEFMILLWDYNGMVLDLGEIIEVTLTLSVSSSDQFIRYLVANDVKQFSFEIVIRAQE